MEKNGKCDLAALKTIERAIRKASFYPSRTALRKILPQKMPKKTFDKAVDYLLASGKVIVDRGKIIWVAVDENSKLAKLLKESVRVR